MSIQYPVSSILRTALIPESWVLSVSVTPSHGWMLPVIFSSCLSPSRHNGLFHSARGKLNNEKDLYNPVSRQLYWTYNISINFSKPALTPEHSQLLTGHRLLSTGLQWLCWPSSSCSTSPRYSNRRQDNLPVNTQKIISRPISNLLCSDCYSSWSSVLTSSLYDQILLQAVRGPLQTLSAGDHS